MNNISLLVADLKDRAELLRQAGVRRIEFGEDGRTLLEGSGYTLLLTPDGEQLATFPSLQLVGGGDVPVEAPPIVETPKQRTDRRASEIAATKPLPKVPKGVASTVTPASPGRASHQFRHLFRDGRCEKNGCGRCEKCGGTWDLTARDEFGDADPHCLQCGARPRREPTAAELGETTPGMGPKIRHRQPTHNGARI